MKRIVLWCVVGLLIVAGVWYAGRKNLGKTPEESVAKAAAETSAPVARPEGDFVIAHVNGEPIYNSEYEIALESLPAAAKNIASRPAGRRLVAEEIIKLKILKQQAEQMGLDRDPAVVSQIAAMRDNLLASAALEKIVSESPADFQAFYEKYKGQFKATSVRQILVAYEGSLVQPKQGAPRLTEAQARDRASSLADRVRKGEDFAVVAKAESDDAESAAKGGELGMLTPGQLGPSLEEPIDKLVVNAISDPIRSAYGVHVFQVTAREVPTFEQVKPSLEKQGMNLRARIVVNAAVKNARVEFEDKFLEPSAQ